MIENLVTIKDCIFDVSINTSTLKDAIYLSVSFNNQNEETYFFDDASYSKVSQLYTAHKNSSEDDEFKLLCKRTSQKDIYGKFKLHLLSFKLEKAPKEEVYSDDYERYDPLADVGMSMYSFI